MMQVTAQGITLQLGPGFAISLSAQGFRYKPPAGITLETTPANSVVLNGVNVSLNGTALVVQ